MINLTGKYKYILIGLLLLAFVYVAGATFYTQTLTYTKTVNMGADHKAWGYLDEDLYHAVLNDGDNLNIDLTLSADKPIDTVEFRLYNVCNAGTFPKMGKFYPKVNGFPAYPTIGYDQGASIDPVLFAAPECPKYGTNYFMTFDTNDSKGTGTYHYSFKYSGYELKIKTLEYYITTVN